MLRGMGGSDSMVITRPPSSLALLRAASGAGFRKERYTTWAPSVIPFPAPFQGMECIRTHLDPRP